MHPLCVKYNKKDIAKAVKIVGGKAKLARYISENNTAGIKLSNHMLWYLLYHGKSINRFTKQVIDKLLLENSKKSVDTVSS